MTWVEMTTLALPAMAIILKIAAITVAVMLAAKSFSMNRSSKSQVILQSRTGLQSMRKA